MEAERAIASRGSFDLRRAIVKLAHVVVKLAHRAIVKLAQGGGGGGGGGGRGGMRAASATEDFYEREALGLAEHAHTWSGLGLG